METRIGLAERSVRAHAEFTGNPLYMTTRHFPTEKHDWTLLRR